MNIKQNYLQVRVLEAWLSLHYAMKINNEILFLNFKSFDDNLMIRHTLHLLLFLLFLRYVIDFIILTTGVQILSAISNYMWLLWLLVSGFLLSVVCKL